MKKLFFGTLIFLSCFGVFAKANATTLDPLYIVQIRAQIDAILAQITEIQKQLNAILGTNSSTTCFDSDNGKNMYVKGVLTTNLIGWAPQSTDSCALMTAPNVYKGQIECSGLNCFVKKYYCDKNTPKVDYLLCSTGCGDGICGRTLSITYPNGGEKTLYDTPVKIQWKAEGFTTEKMNIYLTAYNYYFAPIGTDYLIATNVPVTQKYYNWTVSKFTLDSWYGFDLPRYYYKISLKNTDASGLKVDINTQSKDFFTMTSTVSLKKIQDNTASASGPLF